MPALEAWTESQSDLGMPLRWYMTLGISGHTCSSEFLVRALEVVVDLPLPDFLPLQIQQDSWEHTSLFL